MATILEVELEDYIYDKADQKGFRKNNLNLFGKCFRQVDLKNYGIVDLMFVQFDPVCKAYEVDIVELKKDKINLDALSQICRYQTGVKRFFDACEYDGGWDLYPNGYRGEYNIKMTLIGNGVSDDGVKWIANTIPELDIYQYKLDLSNGLTFDYWHGWQMKDENFKALVKMMYDYGPECKKELQDWIRCCRRSL